MSDFTCIYCVPKFSWLAFWKALLTLALKSSSSLMFPQSLCFLFPSDNSFALQILPVYNIRSRQEGFTACATSRHEPPLSFLLSSSAPVREDTYNSFHCSMVSVFGTLSPAKGDEKSQKEKTPKRTRQIIFMLMERHRMRSRQMHRRQ